MTPDDFIYLDEAVANFRSFLGIAQENLYVAGHQELANQLGSKWVEVNIKIKELKEITHD